MLAAVFGVVGVLVGGILTVAGNYVVFRLQRGEAIRASADAEIARARAERKAAYLRLLATARRLRYVARDPEATDGRVIDDLRSELSTTQYEIELIASQHVVTAVNALRVQTLHYLDQALTGGPTDEARHAARTAVSQMVTAGQRDLLDRSFKD